MVKINSFEFLDNDQKISFEFDLRLNSEDVMEYSFTSKQGKEIFLKLVTSESLYNPEIFNFDQEKPAFTEFKRKVGFIVKAEFFFSFLIISDFLNFILDNFNLPARAKENRLGFAEKILGKKLMARKILDLSEENKELLWIIGQIIKVPELFLIENLSFFKYNEIVEIIVKARKEKILAHNRILILN